METENKRPDWTGPDGMRRRDDDEATKAVADAVKAADPIAAPTDMARVQAKQRIEKSSLEEKLRMSIRRAMTGGPSSPDLVCIWCKKPHDVIDGDRFHAEPIEECPGPPEAVNYRVPAFDEILPEAPRSAPAIKRPRIVRPFGERDDDDE